MDAISTDENPLFRMEDFSVQMQHPWDVYGIMNNPFNPVLPEVTNDVPPPPTLPSPSSTQYRKIAPRPAPPPPTEHDSVRSNFREKVAAGLKLVAEEQSRESLAALWSPTEEDAIPSFDAPEVVNFESDPYFGVQIGVPSAGRSKLQVFGGKGFDGSIRAMDDDDSWEDRVAEHAKMIAKDIEIELLRLYKAVDNNYRQKARSLMFNLSNKSNPELRARVFSGEISPEQLCSMTVDEMAPKELSQWRIAKAEERAQKVVITDEDVNPSKLVKKTHKGEIIMEVDNDVAAEPISSVSEAEPEDATPRDHGDEKVDVSGFGGNHDDVDGNGTTAMVEDETAVSENETLNVAEDEQTETFTDFKGLPEIMSMDGFLKSIGTSEREALGVGSPPTGVGGAGAGGGNDEEMNDVSDVSDGGDGNGDVSQEGTKDQKNEDVGEARNEPTTSSATVVSDGKTGSPVGSPRLKRKEPEGETLVTTKELWSGSLQLTGTRSTAVQAFFRSGQDVQLSAWPKSIEIKGRVKLGPLAKFLTDLSMSKSRTVTVVSFCINDTSSSSASYLKEVADQYTKSERVGYVEPASGFELYLFPPGKSTWKFLSENGRLKRDDVASVEKKGSDAMVGCIVWRKNNTNNTTSEQKKGGGVVAAEKGHKRSKTSKPRSSSKQQPPPAAAVAPPPSSQPPQVVASQVNALSDLLLPPPPPLAPPPPPPPLSVVVKHSNEWQHSATPVVAPDLHFHQQQQQQQQAQLRGSSFGLPPSLSVLQPSSRLPGFEGPPPGFWKPQDDELPEFDFDGFLRAASAAVAAAAAAAAARTRSPPPQPPSGVYHGQAPMVTTSTTSGMMVAPGTQQQHGGGAAAFGGYAPSSSDNGHLMYVMPPRSAANGQFGGGPTSYEQHHFQMPRPPLPPGPPPPAATATATSGGGGGASIAPPPNVSFGQQASQQWMHPNQLAHHHQQHPQQQQQQHHQQKSLYHKKASSASGSGGANTQRRYRH